MNTHPIQIEAFFSLSSGLYIITSHNKGRLNGMISNSVGQITAEPIRITVSINKDNLTHQYISNSKEFSFSVLEESVPLEFIGHFGFKSGKDMDKFKTMNYKSGITQAPLVVEHCLSVVEAKVFHEVDAGSHTTFFADVVSAEVIKQGNPLTYAYYHKIKKGFTPKNAPTYFGDKAKAFGAAPSNNKESEEDSNQADLTVSPAQAASSSSTEEQIYKCGICGYEYNPQKGCPDMNIKPGTLFSDLPDDWKCPVCSAPKSEFDPIS